MYQFFGIGGLQIVSLAKKIADLSQVPFAAAVCQEKGFRGCGCLVAVGNQFRYPTEIGKLFYADRIFQYGVSVCVILHFLSLS